MDAQRRELAARRGDIVDTNGRLLAQSVTSFILTARPRDVKDAGALAKVLARELGLDENNPEEAVRQQGGSVTLARQLSRRTRTGFGRSGKTEILPTPRL